MSLWLSPQSLTALLQVDIDADADLADIAILYTAFVFQNFQPFPKPKKKKKD